VRIIAPDFICSHKVKLLKGFPKIVCVYLLINFFSGKAFSQRYDTLNIYFDVNQYTLTVEHRVELNSLLDKFSEVTHISISGYADTTGSAAYNLQLSRKRAVSVKNYLFTIGLDTLIRDFNYYGEGKAVMAINPGNQRFSRGSTILSDRRTETVVGGKPFNEVVENAPYPVSAYDNIVPVAFPVANVPKNIEAKLSNGIELEYPKNSFPAYIDQKLSEGDETLMPLLREPGKLKEKNIYTVSDDGKLLSPVQVVCFDSILLSNLTTDSAVTLKIPLQASGDCQPDKLRLYASVNNNGTWQWQEQSKEISFEKNEERMLAIIKMNSFEKCISLAYPAETCYELTEATLRFDKLTVSKISATLLTLNSVYIPKANGDNSYKLFLNHNDLSNIFLDITVKDKKNKTYYLRNFPLTACKYVPDTHTYILDWKNLKKYLSL
jgi:hypothetical protein